jgi:hypothetical protein
MSGQTVVYALIENSRRGLDLFESGIAVSIAPDFRLAPGRQFGHFPTPDGVNNPWGNDPVAEKHNTVVDALQGQVM